MEDTMKEAMGIIENKYLIAVDRFRDMVTLGISPEPLTLRGVDAEKKWKISYDLHVSCIWRLSREKRIISGYQDVYAEIDENGDIVENREEEELVRKMTLFEERIFGEMYPDWPLRILKASQNQKGDFRLDLEKGYCFEAFVTYPAEDEKEAWRLMELSSGKHYVWPEEKVKKILLVDEENTDLSQLIKLILQEIVDDDFEIKSAGTQPGEELSDRVLVIGKERYGMNLKRIQKIVRFEQAGFYDYVIPMGIRLPEDIDESVEKILIYQDYETTKNESLKELYEMATGICMALGCNFKIDEEHRERMKGFLERLAEFKQEVSVFHKKK